MCVSHEQHLELITFAQYQLINEFVRATEASYTGTWHLNVMIIAY